MNVHGVGSFSSLEGPDAASFAIVPSQNAPFPQQVLVKFNPDSAGPKVATLVAHPQCGGCFPGVATLTGTGIPPPTATPSPTPTASATPTSTPPPTPTEAPPVWIEPKGHNFGSIGVGGNSDPFAFYIHLRPNVNLGSIYVVGPNATSFTFDDNSTTVTFHPTSSGLKTAILQVYSDCSCGPAEVSLYGTGVAPTTPTPSPAPPPSAILANISTRSRVGTQGSVLIGGFIITGTAPKKIMARAIGPSLPINDAIADPFVALYDSVFNVVWSNNNWRSDQEEEIISGGIPPPNDLDSAIMQILPANGAAYTAVVEAANGTAGGIGLIEIYDLDHSVDSELANISTRGFVGAGDDVMIAGTIVLGPKAQRVLVRAIGPSLPVADNLTDPALELRDSNGLLIRANDNWRSDQEQEIMATGIPPTNDLESAIIETLPAGGAAYTAIVRGVNDMTGVALVEIYALTN